MVHDSPTRLGFVLLGILAREPRSGYDLRKLFSSTPMGRFSDSPGSIYPALRRLERCGWIRPVQPRQPHARKRRVFAVTPQGLSKLKQWLRQPVRRAEVVHALEELQLRYVFTYEVSGAVTAVRFLAETERAVQAYVRELREFLAAVRSQMHLGGRLALEHGIEGYEAYVRWTRRARNELRKERS